MVEFTLEDAAVFLPKYLTPKEQQGLYSELKKFPEKPFAFYDNNPEFKDDLLQGDCWVGLTAINFATLEKKNISGIIISNSCDVDIKNQRDYSPNILFAPLIKLANFEKMLLNAGQDASVVANKIADIKKQSFTSIFYLPSCANVFEESIVMLDDIHRHPLTDFVKKDKNKLSGLSMTAFYLFLIKLSIHFHRVQEGVHRYVP